jgi:hypothetical protein
MGRRRNFDPLPWLNEEMEGQQRGDHHHPIRFFPASPVSRSGRAGIHERVKVYKDKKTLPKGRANGAAPKRFRPGRGLGSGFSAYG